MTTPLSLSTLSNSLSEWQIRYKAVWRTIFAKIYLSFSASQNIPALQNLPTSPCKLTTPVWLVCPRPNINDGWPLDNVYTVATMDMCYGHVPSILPNLWWVWFPLLQLIFIHSPLLYNSLLLSTVFQSIPSLTLDQLAISSLTTYATNFNSRHNDIRYKVQSITRSPLGWGHVRYWVGPIKI